MTEPLEPYEGRPCPVCGQPDPEHDWDAHDRHAGGPSGLQLPGQLTAGLPNMLARASTRGRYSVRVLALHTTEGIMRARDLRAWTAWTGSSHASADRTGALLGPEDGFVPYHLAAWTLRSGNPWSENLELCGFASWTRAEWLSLPDLLEAAARWLAERSKATGVPLVKITAAQYRAGASGVIDHHDHTVGYQDGTHWDVGENFPWDVVLPRAIAINTPAPAIRAARIITMEEPVQLLQGQEVALPVPPIPAGHKAVLSVVSDSVHGAVIYSKGHVETKASAVLTTAPGWDLWVRPGSREDRDVSKFSAVYLINRGAEKHPDATAAATITVVPA